MRLPQPKGNIGFQVFILILALVFVAGFITSIFVFIGLYLNIAIKSTGIIRKKGICVSLGILLFFIAVLGGNLTRYAFIGTPLELIGPIALLIGLIIMVYGFNLKMK